MCAPDKRIIAQQTEMISKLEAEIQHYKKTIHDNEVEKQQSAYEYLNHIIDDDNYLYGTTGMNREEFEWIQERFEKVIEYSPKVPRFSDYVDDPGNTCILTASQILFVTLCRKRNNPKQELLAAIAGVDQSTISRYLTFSDELLMNILPTAKNIGAAIRTIRTSELFKKFVPGRGGGEMYLDATFVQVQRPQENQEVVYSGKRKRHVYNVQITSNKDGLVLDIGGPEEGSVHDMEVLRRNPPNFGKWTDGMKNSDTKKERQIMLYTDKGYLSVEKDYRGIISKQPYKKPKGKGLTETEREYSKRISRKRIKVEHAINRLKWFRRMSAVYDDTMDAFYTEIQVVTGLTNLHIMLKDRKYIEPLEKVCAQIK